MLHALIAFIGLNLLFPGGSDHFQVLINSNFFLFKLVKYRIFEIKEWKIKVFGRP